MTTAKDFTGYFFGIELRKVDGMHFRQGFGQA